MLRNWKNCVRLIAAIAILVGAGGHAIAEEDAPWRVGKSSGEVWITVPGVQQASLAPEAQLKSGDTIRTGRNGRVLLTRGEETILVSPNSVIGIPTQRKQGLSTTILQQAGSILLEVEKRNVKHFEVETPNLAAVVKGTQFRVSVNANGTSVDVLRGQVEVADFKSGQIAQVLAGQAATYARGKSGLTLSGTGTFKPIEQGKPRASLIERIMVPKTGLAAPRSAATGQQIHALNHLAPAGAKLGANRPSAARAAAHDPLRISTSLGEVQLNIRKVTNGLAHAAVDSNLHSGRNGPAKDTIWSSNEAKANTGFGSSSNQGNSANSGNSAAGSTSIAGSAANASAVSTVAASASSGNNGNGASSAGRGNSGNSQGSNGNGSGNGNGNGNNGNGNGNGNNGNNGNGNGNGHSKK